MNAMIIGENFQFAAAGGRRRRQLLAIRLRASDLAWPSRGQRSRSRCLRPAGHDRATTDSLAMTTDKSPDNNHIDVIWPTTTTVADRQHASRPIRGFRDMWLKSWNYSINSVTSPRQRSDNNCEQLLKTKFVSASKLRLLTNNNAVHS